MSDYTELGYLKNQVYILEHKLELAYKAADEQDLEIMKLRAAVAALQVVADRRKETLDK